MICKIYAVSRKYNYKTIISHDQDNENLSTRKLSKTTFQLTIKIMQTTTIKNLIQTTFYNELGQVMLYSGITYYVFCVWQGEIGRCFCYPQAFSNVSVAQDHADSVKPLSITTDEVVFNVLTVTHA